MFSIPAHHRRQIVTHDGEYWFSCLQILRFLCEIIQNTNGCIAGASHTSTNTLRIGCGRCQRFLFVLQNHLAGECESTVSVGKSIGPDVFKACVLSNRQEACARAHKFIRTNIVGLCLASVCLRRIGETLRRLFSHRFFTPTVHEIRAAKMLVYILGQVVSMLVEI